MGMTYTNRAGKLYSLYRSVTRTGRECYFFSTRKNSQAEPVAETPTGYEIVERPENGQVFLKKIVPQLITKAEEQTVATLLAGVSNPVRYLQDCRGEHITIYESCIADNLLEDETVAQVHSLGFNQTRVNRIILNGLFLPILRFGLRDAESRYFSVERFCFMGAIDDWIFIGCPDALETLAAKYIGRLGTDAFYDPFG
ncbi:hypothetical protein GCM10023116_03090 [Kistimonas scapharcae]|uniref:Uncharacterized protein n=1 Tax=Kistimonas scapharcae TaxID=1036133 RepID=A0ABP8UZR4_9GAMM